MTTTPLPPQPKPAFKLKWHRESARYTVSEPAVNDTWCFTSWQLAEYAQEARADLEAENKRLREALSEVVGCFEAAESEGLQAALENTAETHLKDLLERRLMHALYAAHAVLETKK